MLLAVVASGALLVGPSAAQSTIWTGNASSDWFNASNWNSGVPGPWSPGGVPQHRAIIDNGGSATVAGPGALSGLLTVGNTGLGLLTIQPGGTLDLSGEPGAGVIPLTIGEQAGGNGTVIVSGAGANLSTSAIYVGRAGTGDLQVLNGGLVGSATSYAAIGVAAGSHGTATVDAARWDVGQLFVGSSGIGELTLRNGGKMTVSNMLGATAGMDANSVGTITVDGAGSVLDDQGWLTSMTLGYNGTGHLVVSNKGVVTSLGTCMGCGTGGVGTALVTGAGSKWQLTDTSYEYSIGGSGTGTLTVADSGLFQADNSGLAVTFGSVSTGRGTLHLTTGGMAQFNILNLGGGAGSAGSVGEAIVESGGQLSSKGGNLGTAAGTLGKVTVTGAGSRWDHTAQLTLGYEGRGELVVSAGGVVASQSGVIASNPGSTGTATVTGANSTWTNTQNLSVGNRGVGSLFVQDRGQVSAGSLSVGPGGQGTVEISSGGGLTTGAVLIGHNGTAGTAMSPTTGEVLVTGAGSSLASSTYAWLGFDGAQGMLTIADAATVSLNNGVYDPSTFGGVLYLGDDSVAGSSGTLNIGGKTVAAAPGTLTAEAVAFNTPGDMLNFNHTAANYAFAPVLAGNGTVSVRAGSTHLTGNSSDFIGTVSVLAGKLYVDNRLGGGMGGSGALAVSAGGTLGGTGMIAGPVTVADGGTLEGRSGQTLTMGSLVLSQNSNVDVALGAPSASPLFNVIGAFTLDGRLNATNAGGLTSGTYRLADYGGAFINNGLLVTSVPAGFNPGDWSIDTATANQVNLVIPASGANTQYWDGSNTTPGGVADGRGGSGIWNGANTNWTNQAGNINAPWASGAAVFNGSNGAFNAAVTVDAAGVTATGLRFIGVQNYRFGGGAINLAPGAAIDVATGRIAVFDNAIAGGGNVFVTGGGDATFIGDVVVAGGMTIDNRTTTQGFSTPPRSLQLAGGPLVVGSSSGGQSRLAAYGTLTTPGGVIGSGLGSSGTVDLIGGVWNAGNQNIVVGDAGTGTLTLTSVSSRQGQVSADRIVLGNQASGHGTVNFSFAGLAPGNIAVNEIVGGVGGGMVRFSHNPGVPARDFPYHFSVTMSGNLSTEFARGETHLAGTHDYTGPTNVSGGRLILNGASLLNTDLDVKGGVLGGFGSIGGSVKIGGQNNEGVQSYLEGASGQTIRMGSLTLLSDAHVEVTLGAPSSTALYDIAGNLTLDGQLQVMAAPGYGDGVYRLFDYGGMLTDNGLDIASLPSGSSSATVQTAIANQVNLVVGGSGPGPVPTTQFWNGTTTVADGTIHGGAGTWIVGPTNWTDSSGSAANAWGGRMAVFQNNPGIVTVDNSAGAISATGMQFIGAGWTVTGGSVALNGAGNSTAIRVGDGTLSGASHTVTIASALTGASRLVKDDLGTLILTGANSYTGGTTIANGILEVGDGGTAGAIIGDVLNNGALVFNRSDATTFGGAITGSGGVQLVSGDLTFTASNSYAFGTDIASGATLRIGNGGTSGSIAGRVANAGTLAFNRSNDLTFAGFFIGNGAIRQVGAGKTELTGDSSGFAGTTTVENGVLAVNGKLGGGLDVWAGARLQGIGTVAHTIIGGTVAPGNSIGTLNVAGNITFNAGSIYEVEVNAAGQSDLIKASGSATIAGGRVEVLAGMGSYAPATTYTILTANGGRTGTFTGGATSNLAFLDPSLSYDSNNVYLTMTRNGMAFQNVGITPNQIAAGNGAESLGLGNQVHDAVLNLSAPQAQRAFDQLSGEIHASTKTAMIEDSRFIRNAVNDRLRAAFDGAGPATVPVMAYAGGGLQYAPATIDRFAIWGQAFGSWGQWNSNGNAAQFNRSIGGFFIGADAPVFDTWRFGAVAGYSHTTFDARDRASSGSSDNYHLGLYGGTALGNLALRTGAAYTWHDITSNRSVIFPGFGDSLAGKYDAGTAQVFGELAYGFDTGSVRFEPFANLAYVSLYTGGLAERGGAAALSSQSSTTDAAFTTLGLRASTTFDLGNVAVTAKGTVGWRHAFGDATPNAVMRFASGGDAFSVGGVPTAREAAVVDAGLDFSLSPDAVLGVSYGSQFSSGGIDQTFRVNFSARF